MFCYSVSSWPRSKCYQSLFCSQGLFQVVPNQAPDFPTLITTYSAIIISEKWNMNNKTQWNIDFLIGINEFLIPYSTPTAASDKNSYFCVITAVVLFASETVCVTAVMRFSENQLTKHVTLTQTVLGYYESGISRFLKHQTLRWTLHLNMLQQLQ